MNIGILITAVKDLATTISIYERIAADINPDFIWFGDRLLIDNIILKKNQPPDEGLSAPKSLLDPFIALTAISRLDGGSRQLGISVTDFVRRSPVDIARTCFTLSQLLGSPMHIGFGSGESINLSPLGYSVPDKPVTFLREKLTIFDTINREGIYSSDKFGEIELGYNATPSHIWIGGQRDRMLELTSKYAHGWIPAWKMPSLEYKEKSMAIRNMSKNFNRACPKLGMFAVTSIADSKKVLFEYYNDNPENKLEAAYASSDLWESWGLKHPFGEKSKGFSEVILSEIPETKLLESIRKVPSNFIEKTTFAGCIDEISSELKNYKKCGMEHLSIAAPLIADPQKGFILSEKYPQFVELCKDIKSW
jgi:phthiodiolone/phenolphthiodiolone dimycocerosates ketoreductase